MFHCGRQVCGLQGIDYSGGFDMKRGWYILTVYVGGGGVVVDLPPFFSFQHLGS